MVLANFFIQEFELRIVWVIPFRMSLQSPLRFRGFLSLSKSSSPALICCHVAAPHAPLLKCPRMGWFSPRRTSWAHESSSWPCLSRCLFQRQAWRDPDESYHATVLFTCTESQLIFSVPRLYPSETWHYQIANRMSYSMFHSWFHKAVSYNYKSLVGHSIRQPGINKKVSLYPFLKTFISWKLISSVVLVQPWSKGPPPLQKLVLAP